MNNPTGLGGLITSISFPMSTILIVRSRKAALESHVAKTVSSGLCLQKRCRAVHSGVEISVALVKRAFDPITYVREVLPLFFNKAFLPSFTLISIMIYGPDLNYSKRKQYKRPKPLLAPSHFWSQRHETSSNRHKCDGVARWRNVKIPTNAYCDRNGDENITQTGLFPNIL